MNYKNAGNSAGFGGIQRPGLTTGVKNIMKLTVAIYIAQLVFGRGFTDFFGLIPNLFREGYIWQVLTYTFLHDPNGMSHIAFNMLTLYFCGAEVERVLGLKKFVWFYILCGIGGALVSIGVALVWGGGNVVTIGASAAVLGVLIAFAQMNPQATFLLFFIIPIKAKQMTILMVIINVVMGLQQGSGGGGIAVWAHLGGMAVGYLLITWDKKTGFSSSNYPFLDFIPNLKRSLSNQKAKAEFHKASTEKDRLDILLDKIARLGMPSLSEEERAFLTDYSRRQSTKR